MRIFAGSAIVAIIPLKVFWWSKGRAGEISEPTADGEVQILVSGRKPTTVSIASCALINNELSGRPGSLKTPKIA